MPESQSRNVNNSPFGKFRILSRKDRDELLLNAVFVQPGLFDEELCTKAKCLVYPQPIRAKDFDVACEWASSSEAPMFIVEEDLPRFEAEGFGAYRFQLIREAREVGFSFASLRFFRARSRRYLGVRGLLQDWVENWGYRGPSHYHVLVREQGESEMYLATPFLNDSEWSILVAEGACSYWGSHQFAGELWEALSERWVEELPSTSPVSRVLSKKTVLQKPSAP